MSLINNMLSDLQARQGNFKYEDDLVFDGLIPVTETKFTKSRIPYNFLLVSFSLVLISIASLSHFFNADKQADVLADAQINKVQSAITSEDLDIQPSILSNEDVQLLSRLETELMSVSEIDISTPALTGITSEPVINNTSIYSINIIEDNDVTNIEIILNNKENFSVFILDNPDRLVVELENTKFMDGTPPSLNHSYLQSIGYSNQEGGNLRVIMVSSRPLSVADSNISVKGEDYLLSINILPKEREIQALPVFTNNIPIEQESSIGHMEINPSSGNSDISLERYLIAVRQMYSQNDYERADEEIQSILQDHPLYVEARSLYASTLISRNQINTAMQVLASGLRLDPGISDWAKLYARLLIDQGQINPAIIVLERGLPEITDDYDYYAMYAALLQREGRHREAIETYKSLLNHNPDNGVWWMGLAISQDVINESSEALYSYNMALQGQSIDYELRNYILEQIQRLSD